MPSTISCPHCDARLKLPDSVVGKTVKCPKCNRAFVASLPGTAAVGDTPPSAQASVSPNRPEPSTAGPKTKAVAKTGHQHGWFIKTSSGNVGPFSNETVVIAAKEGIIRPDMTLWHDKLQRTVAAGEMSGLFPQHHAARQSVQAAQVGGDNTYAVGPDEDGSFAELQKATAPVDNQFPETPRPNAAETHETALAQRAAPPQQPPLTAVVVNNLAQTTGGQVRCPKCGSTQITSNKKGFSGGKACLGWCLGFGIFSLLCGLCGKNKVLVTCLACGHQWLAGKK